MRRVDLASGRPEKQRALGPRYFGEGIAILGGLLYQLTWQNGVVVVYDLETFDVERTMQYDGEGWGLTHDGRQLIMSDGSATIRFRDPQTFSVTREIEVRSDGVPLSRLNELEYVDGEIWAKFGTTTASRGSRRPTARCSASSICARCIRRARAAARRS